jgi:hypothetical protein
MGLKIAPKTDITIKSNSHWKTFKPHSKDCYVTRQLHATTHFENHSEFYLMSTYSIILSVNKIPFKWSVS